VFDNGLKKIFTSIRASYLPALIFSLAAFWYYAVPEPLPAAKYGWHIAVFVLSLLNFLFAVFVAKNRMAFAVLWILAMYLAVNYLHLNGQVQTFSFHFLAVMLALNWLYFMLEGEQPLYRQDAFYLLCFLLAEWVFFENLSVPDSFLPWAAVYIICLAVLGACLIIQGRSENILTAAMPYALLSLYAGLSDPLGAPLYFAAASLIMLTASVQDYGVSYFRDSLTGVYSRNSYYIRARRSFPLKYSIGVICIDDYAKLLKVFGRRRTDMLTLMVVNKIREVGIGAEIYRYTDDEFILVFKNEDKKQSYEYLETIRRAVAGAEFVLGAHKTVKITISAGVSEKKRSDADVDVVLARTREVLQKAYKFTQNITSKA